MSSSEHVQPASTLAPEAGFLINARARAQYSTRRSRLLSRLLPRSGAARLGPVRSSLVELGSFFPFRSQFWPWFGDGAHGQCLTADSKLER